MTVNSSDQSNEILRWEPALLAQALRLTGDETEASQLVGLVIQAALEDEARIAADGVSGAWLFGLLRASFHSVARRRAIQRERSSAGRLWQPDRAQAFATAPVEAE